MDTKTNRGNFATRLAWAMGAAGFKSQEGLAQAAGLSQPAVHWLLKRKFSQGPRAGTVRKLAKACQASCDWLAHGDVQSIVYAIELTKHEADWLALLAYLECDDIIEFAELIRKRQTRNRPALLAERCQDVLAHQRSV